MERKLTIALTAIRIANITFAFAVLFVLAGFAMPQSLGQLINPHSEEGSKGVTVVMVILLLVFVALVASLPIAIVARVRKPASLPAMSLANIAFGSIIALFLAYLVVSLVVDKL